MSNRNKKPTIAVVTTFFNAEKFVLNAVHSVAQQITNNLFDIEYVIVDDKSEDTSRKQVEQYIANVGRNFKDVTFNIVEPEKNLGCGGARRFGIQTALKNKNVKYLAFLDADDYYMIKDFLLKAYNEFIGPDKPDIVEFGIMFNQADGSQQPSVSQRRIVCKDKHLAALYIFNDNLRKFNVWTKVYTRAIIESKEYSDTRTFEDVRTTPIWMQNADTIVILPVIGINYRAAGGSIIRDDMLKTRIGTITAMSELIPYFKDDRDAMKALYGRAMVDLTAVLHDHSSENPGFNIMSRLNDKFLKVLYPNDWQDKVYIVEDDPELKNT